MSMRPIIGVPILLVNRYSDAFIKENIGMSIGKRVREARKSAGLTQKELATKAGMTQSSLSELETGESAGTTNVATLARHLGVNAYWLETGKGEPRGNGGSLTQLQQIERAAPKLQFVSDEEASLLDFFRGTDAEGREMILSAAAGQPRVVRPSIVSDKSQPN